MNKKANAFWKKHPYLQLVVIALIASWILLIAWIIFELPRLLWESGIRQACREFKYEIIDFFFTKSSYHLWR